MHTAKAGPAVTPDSTSCLCRRARRGRWRGACGAFNTASKGSSPLRPAAWLGLVALVACGRTGLLDGAQKPVAPPPGDVRLDAPSVEVIRELGTFGRGGCGAYRSGALYCWGEANVLLGRTADTAPQRVRLGADEPVKGVGLYFEQGCALLASGKVWCWGWSHRGQLGGAVAIGARVEVPVELPDVRGVDRLSSGHHHVCGLTETGQVACWGGPYSPALGDPGVRQSQAPIHALGVSDAIDVAAGTEHTCAVTRSGLVLCWGANANGELGDGTHVSRASPTRVVGVEDAVQVSAGVSHTCARHRTGQVSCWGGAPVGDGATRRSSSPVVAATIRDAEQLAAGAETSCVVRSGGEVWCWGYLTGTGLGASDIALTPVRVPGVEGAVALAVGAGLACAGLATGGAVCWSREPPARVAGLP